MDPERPCMEEEEDTLDDTNIELHPSYVFEEHEVIYMDVFVPDAIAEEDNDVQADPNINPW